MEYSPKTYCKSLTPALIKQNVLDISWRALCVLTSSSHRSIMFKMLAIIWCHCYLTLPFPNFSAVRNPEYLNLSGQSSALIFLIQPWVRTAALPDNFKLTFKWNFYSSAISTLMSFVGLKQRIKPGSISRQWMRVTLMLSSLLNFISSNAFFCH